MITLASNCGEKDSLQQLVKFSALALPFQCSVCFYFSPFGSVWALRMPDSLWICFNVGLLVGLFNINQLQMF